MGNADGMSRRGAVGDDFKTPPMCIKALIEHHRIDKSATILDPCCGNKVIGNTLRDLGYKNITEYDIKKGYNFHAETKKFDYIIMNSPYSDKVNFLFKAFTVAENIISILPQNVTNYNIFQALFMGMPFFVGKYLMRPKFFMTWEDVEIPTRGGVSAYAWFVWKVSTKGINKESWERYVDLEKYFK